MLRNLKTYWRVIDAFTKVEIMLMMRRQDVNRRILQIPCRPKDIPSINTRKKVVARIKVGRFIGVDLDALCQQGTPEFFLLAWHGNGRRDLTCRGRLKIRGAIHRQSKNSSPRQPICG